MTIHTFMTSGSTGEAKRFTIDDDFLTRRAAVRTQALAVALADTKSVLCDLPPSNIVTISYIDWAKGNNVKFFSGAGSTAKTLALAEKEKIDTIISTPGGLCNYARANGVYKFHAAIGTSMMMSDVQSILIEDDLADTVYTVYGASEVGAVAIASGDQIRLEKGCVGAVCPDVQIRFVDGELQVKTPTMIAGYDDPEITARYFADGWFRTGDAAKQRDDGLIVLSGRIKIT